MMQYFVVPPIMKNYTYHQTFSTIQHITIDTVLTIMYHLYSIIE